MSSGSFRNESPIDFSIREERDVFAKHLKEVKELSSQGIFQGEILINGESVAARNSIESINPSHMTEIVGETAMATTDHVESAISTLLKGQKSWAKTGFNARASIIRKVAQQLRSKHHQLAALIVLEAGKPWAEADADVCEAIDFCDYYAGLAEAMDEPQHLMPHLLGEMNHYSYAPRGLTVVISPWNFPLAIACGMTVASLVTGNATILKPAEQTTLIAQEFAKILYEAGIPGNAFAFLPGEGEVVGRALVASKETKMVCFTGSRPVGLEILKRCAELQDGQHHIKRTILELGGKNAIIVDSDADFDDAIKGTLYSAFGFAGQKCSACSRLIVVGDAYEPFVERLSEAAADLIIGSAEAPATYVGPLIDEESQERVLKIINQGKQELNVAYLGDTPDGGSFSPIAIFRDVPHSHSIWREEIFAPVLACSHAESVEEAITIANDSHYALTGGMFSRSPKHLELAKTELQVGNLYLNRSITGAIVGRQPFGGFKLSGIGSKAGGSDYLLQFVEPRTATENTMRKGFTPELAV